MSWLMPDGHVRPPCVNPYCGKRSKYDCKGCRPKCPHCGNVKLKDMTDNGCKGYDLVVLCLATIAPGEDDSCGRTVGDPDDDADGKCHMQWQPSEQDDEDEDSCELCELPESECYCPDGCGCKPA
jgi:hypothetical protein